MRLTSHYAFLPAFILICVIGVICGLRGFETRGLTVSEAYLFAYFTGNAESGLYLAHSSDGLKWTALNEGNPVLAPKIGRDKLMRDPHITLGPDGLYHMVWILHPGLSQ